VFGSVLGGLVNHRIALCFCIGLVLKFGRSVHSAEMSCGLVLCRVSVWSCVQLYISFPAPHSVRRCNSVSVLPHFSHRSVLVSAIRWSRCLVGIML
jgi:hypothetical protein